MVTRFNSHFTLKDCLFGGVKSAKNADPDKYVYRGYVIEFDSCSEFSLTDGSAGENVSFWGLISAHQCMLIIREKYLNTW